jgi:hypothetical protein
MAAAHAAVEEDGDTEVEPDPVGDGESRPFGGRHRARLEWDERDDVDRADPWMDAFVSPKVDELDCARSSCDECVDERIVVAHEGEDRAVVIGVRVDVEERRASCEGPPDPGYRSGVAPFGHVRHGFEHDPYPTST